MHTANFLPIAYSIWFCLVMLIISLLARSLEFIFGFAIASLFCFYFEHLYNHFSYDG